MPDQVESILRRIHLLFAKCEAYQGSPDKIILSKREMFDILQELNTSIYEVLDQYEATTRSREKAKLEIERQANEILSNARQNAQEVHAASLIYTDTMLDEIKKITFDMQAQLESDYQEFQDRLEERLSFVSENKEELKTQLTALNESERYLKLLQEKKDNLLKKEIPDKRKIMKISEPKKIEPAFDEMIEFDDYEFLEEYDEPKKAEIIVKVHTQTLPLTGNEPENKQDIKTYKREDTDIKKESSKQEELSAAVEQEYGSKIFSSEDFDLDAEYYEWKEKKEGKEVESLKKEKRSFFGKRR